VRDGSAGASEERHPSGRERNVSGKDYDPLPGDAQPPLRVRAVSIEPIDPAALELLAGDMLRLLDWARRNKEQRHE
jgi:hypothetical protein